MPDAPNPADHFSWRMVDAIRYCTDIAGKAGASPQAIERARTAAHQIAAMLPPREVETMEIVGGMPK